MEKKPFRVLTNQELDMAHKALLCLKNSETEFGLFCAGCHAMFLSLFGRIIDSRKYYPVDRREIPVLCAIADHMYDWFEELKRTEAVEADMLKKNHKVGEALLSTILATREKERAEARGEKGDKEDEESR